MARLLRSDEKLISEARRRYDEAIKSWSKNHEYAREDFRMEAGDQWDKAALKDRTGRPSLVINKLYGVVQQIVGDQRQNRPSIKVQGVDDQSDPEIAEIQTGLIRNIQNNSDAEAAYDTAFSHAVKGGFGFFRINTKYSDCDVFEQDITIERILDPFSVVVDPFAQRADKSDARYILVCEVMSKTDFDAKYPKHQASSFDTDKGGSWYPSDSVMVAEYWYKEPATKTLWLLATGETVDGTELGEDAVTEIDGQRFLTTPEGTPIPIVKERQAAYDKVKWAKLTAHAVIDKRDWPGKYIPVVGVYGDETTVDGDILYRSAIRYAHDAQKTYNWMRSTAVETIAQAPRQPFMLTPRQVEGHEGQWAKMHNSPQPYLLYNASGDPIPQKIGGSVPDIGAIQEAQIAADDIKATTGIYDAALGARSNETSGKAIMARQREGDVATFVFVDNLSRAIRLAGRIIVDLIPHIYDTQRTIRILGEDGSEDVAEVNKVVIDPSAPNGQTTVNDLTRGKYDVVVNVGPSYTTKRVEAAESMVAMAQVFPQLMEVAGDLVAKAQDWPGADEIADRLKKLLPPGLGDSEEQQDPQAQQQAAMQQEQAMAMQQLANQQQQVAAAKEMVQLEQEKQKLKGIKLDNAKKTVELQKAAMPQGAF